MTMNLIPQDELTLDLLAEVLAKMYRYSSNNKHNAPDKVVEPASGASSADPEIQRYDDASAERDLAQVESNT